MLAESSPKNLRKLVVRFLTSLTTDCLIEEFEIYLTSELDMMINTIANKMKTLKSFLQISWSEGIIDFNPFKKHGIIIYTEETDSVVFTRDEMIALEKLDLSSNPFHEKIRDQYLIYLWSGIRKGDLKNLISVINPHTNKFVFRTGKKDEISEIPAFETLIKIAINTNTISLSRFMILLY